MDYERFVEIRSSSIEKYQNKISKAKEKRDLFEKENAEGKVEAINRLIEMHQQTIQRFQAELNFCRPEKPADIAERRRIYKNYAKTISQTISEENPVFFHGVKSLAFLEPILSSGHLGDVEGSSQGMVDVTGRNSIQTTLDEFVGIQESFIKSFPFLPAGCIFVIAPQNEEEKLKAQKGDVTMLPPVDFSKDPKRLVAIVSTSENQDYIKGLCKKYGVSMDKVCTFDAYVEKFQKEKSSDLLKYLSRHTVNTSPLAANIIKNVTEK
ncbi:MAG: hypothetical protein J6Y03_05155 [Alphaproteobacteria bacterium]|nr:hypothetical protein [Alphaproteobacteria bacterium]